MYWLTFSASNKKKFEQKAKKYKQTFFYKYSDQHHVEIKKNIAELENLTLKTLFMAFNFPSLVL